MSGLASGSLDESIARSLHKPSLANTKYRQRYVYGNGLKATTPQSMPLLTNNDNPGPWAPPAKVDSHVDKQINAGAMNLADDNLQENDQGGMDHAQVDAGQSPGTSAASTSMPQEKAAASSAPPSAMSAAVPVQAASAPVAATMINAAAATQNPDGSTSVFGAQGNAVENMNSEGKTIFSDPLATAGEVPVPIWYAPAQTNDYFQNILNNPQIFSTVIGGIAVFKMYAVMASWPDATVKAFFTYLSQNNIKLGIEAPPLVAGTGQLGYGIESFGTPGALVAMVTRIRTLGGTLSYVGWDEPLYYENVVTKDYTLAGLAAQVVTAANAVTAIFPNVQFGDIEPVDGSSSAAANLRAWFAAYAQAAPSPFRFFQADIATWSQGWQAQLASTIAAAHADHMSVGAIVNGLDAADSNNAWATQAVANAQLILSDPALRPDYLVVQSWQSIPSEAGDPNAAGTLASVAADVSASEKAALAVLAVAQYSTAGLLQSVTWTGGWKATQDGSVLRLSSPTGVVVFQTDWSTVQSFSFDRSSATVSLTRLVLASAAGAVPAWQSEASSIGVGPNGFEAMTPLATSGPGLTLGLATSSRTGFASSGITNQAKPTLAGTARPGDSIALQADGTGVGTATASGAGTWSLALNTTLSNGAHVLQATDTNAATGASTREDYVVSVDTASTAQPTLALAPGSDSSYPGDNITDVAQPVLTGVADPNSAISLVIDGKAAATIKADPSGQWSYALNTALAPGEHMVQATAINPAGTSSAPAGMLLTIDTASQKAAATSPDPLFDAAWYLQEHPNVATSGLDPYAQFMTTGWKQGYDPDPFFSTSYYLAQYPDVAAAGVNPLAHFEQNGWREGRNTSSTENTGALSKSLPGASAGEDPLVAYIRTLEFTNLVATARPNATLAVSLLHDTGALADRVTSDPTLAITADPGATLIVAVGTATPTTVTIGSTGSWNHSYAPASLADGSYAVTVKQAEPGGGNSTAALNFTLDRTPPVVTAVGMASTAGAALGAGNAATITVTLSEAVRVTGTPTLTLNNGGVATYSTGSGGKALTFAYRVSAGQGTSALAAVAINLPNGAAIADIAGNAANLAGAASVLSGPVVVETQLPGAGSSITLTGAATVTATQSLDGYTVALEGSEIANAPTIAATSAIFGGHLAMTVAGAGSAARYGSLRAIGNDVNNGTLSTRAGTIGGAATLSVAISGAPGATGTLAAGVLTNAGKIDAEAGSTVNIVGTTGSTLVNSGSLVANGMIFLGTTVSGTGKIIVGAASNAAGLEVQGALPAGQSVLLDAGTLTIDNLSSFHATVSGFNTHGRIVLKGVNAATEAYSNGIVLLNGGQAGSLHLQSATGSNLSSGSFVLGHSGGATTITMT